MAKLTTGERKALFNAANKVHTYKVMQSTGYQRIIKKATDERTKQLLVEISNSELDEAESWSKTTKQLVEGEKKFKLLQDKLDKMKHDDNTKKGSAQIKVIEEKMKKLKRNIVKLKTREIMEIKELITAFNMVYYDAPNEADEVCAYLCCNGYVDACMSEDSDMFIYGCPVILKHISMVYESVKEYKYSEVLKSLRITCDNFRRLCILSGTDYNTDNKYNKYNIFYYYKRHVSFTRNKRNYLLYKFKVDESLPDNEERLVLRQIYDNYTVIDYTLFSDALELDFIEEKYNEDDVIEVLKKHKYYFV